MTVSKLAPQLDMKKPLLASSATTSPTSWPASRGSSFDAPVLAPFGLLESPVRRRSPHANAAEGPAFFPPEEPAAAAEEPVSWGTFLRRLLAFTGPGWLMSVAYVDPGNLEADLQAGAHFGYALLWALFVSTGIGLGMQLVAARLGCATQKHLAEHCRDQYPPLVRVVLWLMTELAIIGSDIQEVIGCSIGLELLFGLPLPVGVVVTAGAAFAFLFLERLGTRPLELFFGVLLLILAGSMAGLFVMISPDRLGVLEGFLVPRMPRSAVQQVVGMLGCVVMPHNLFLHSALVQSRVLQKGEEKEAIRLFTVESAAAIGTSLFINTCVVAVFAKGFYGKPETATIGLRNAGQYLGDAFGGPMRVIWALGLCAAGQSSTMTGAYAGQWVMQGYLELKVKPWKRAIITRTMALSPTLLVAVIFGGESGGLDTLNMYLNVLQSLVLPFAAVPLLIFASNKHLMGDMAVGFKTLTFLGLALVLVMVANVYLLTVQLAGANPSVTAGFGLLAVAYIGAVVYIARVPLTSGAITVSL